MVAMLRKVFQELIPGAESKGSWDGDDHWKSSEVPAHGRRHSLRSREVDLRAGSAS